MNKINKIGIDFHGVLEECKDDEYIKELLESLNYFCFVHVVSGPPLEQLNKELIEAGYEIGKHYISAISTVDYMKSKNIEMWQDENGDWWTDEDTWWDSKSMICEEYDIDILIDDSIKYKDAFKNKKKFFHYKGRSSFVPILLEMMGKSC